MQSKSVPLLYGAPASSRSRNPSRSPDYEDRSSSIHNSQSLLFVEVRDVKFSRRNHRFGGFRMVRACSDSALKDNIFYMKKCVELARKAIGWTSPNPMVGCVIVKGGEIVGEGFHPQAGQPHAEVFALRDAGSLAENATAYVSLEPCNHYGRTPPCTEALIKAKVKKVVVGMVDPNPIVLSKGLDRLRSVGIEVVTGVEEELCKKLNEGYIHQMLTGKPFVTLRCSISSNGILLNFLGDRALKQGGYYSKMLQEYDAVVVSSSLVETNSFPMSVEPGANQPITIVVAKSRSSKVRIPHLTSEVTGKVVIFKEELTPVHPEIVDKGVETVVLEHLNLDAILDYCKRRGACCVLIDLRGCLDDFERLLQGAVENKMLQKAVCEVLPTYEDNRTSTSLHGPLTTIIDKVRLHASQSDKRETNVVELDI